MMKLKVWGGAGEHGRSAYLLSGSKVHLLLDCGVKKEGAGEYPLIDPEIVPQLGTVLLSHAHEDHSVAIPLLYRMGYTGEVWTTRETREQLNSYFQSWRNNMERAGNELPYTEADEQAIRYRYLEDQSESAQWFEILPDVQVMWGKSGHLAGSVWLGLRMEGKRIFYSGDYTSESMLLQDDCPADTLLMHDDQWVQKQRTGTEHGERLGREGVAVSTKHRPKTLEHVKPLTEIASLSHEAFVPHVMDLTIMDAAYGTDSETQQDKLMQLHEALRQTLERGGKVLLPMPAVGRGQELVLWSWQQFPGVPLIVEPKLAAGMMQLLHSPYWLKKSGDLGQGTAVDVIKRFLNEGGWSSPTTNEERQQLLERTGPSLWFISDGMMQSTLARWYYKQFADDSKNLVLITGHAAKGTFAHRLLENPEGYGACEVRKIRYKVHQGVRDVRGMLNRIPAKHTVLVHADRAETDRLKQTLLKERDGLQPEKGLLHSLGPGEELIL